jgi:chemotaxis methyl-accepting protein methylase
MRLPLQVQQVAELIYFFQINDMSHLFYSDGFYFIFPRNVAFVFKYLHNNNLLFIFAYKCKPMLCSLIFDSRNAHLHGYNHCKLLFDG